MIVTYAIKMAEWGVPVSVLNARLLAKSYLDRKGLTTRFKSNFPGEDWALSFLKRHKQQISQRLAPNISRNRASRSKVEIF